MTKKTRKFGGAFLGIELDLLVWYLSMDQFQYKIILEETMLPYADEVLSAIWIFQNDNDPNFEAYTVEKFCITQSVSVLD